MNKPVSKLLVLALTAALASGAAWAQSTTDSTSTDTSTQTSSQASTQLVTRYSTLAGSDSNAQSIIDGLRTGSDITLSSDAGDVTFTPAASSLGYGEINTSLALAQAELSAAGITDPTADQLQAALNGGSVTLADGSTADMQGILDLRASGEGWGQIANDLGLNLGAVVSASHTDHSQAGMHGSSGDSNSTADANAGADASSQASVNGEASSNGMSGTAQAQASIDAHDTAGAHPDVSSLPGQRPSRPDLPQRPDVPQRPDIPQHPDIPDHAGRPGG